jgi:3-oxoacyl-[acyl-carrier protein] reductase
MPQTAIVTGTRKGIGKSIAIHLLDNGWNIAGCSRGEATIEHENYSHFMLDVRDELSVVKMVRETARKHDRIDALINNAGTASLNHCLLTPGSTLEKLFSTNVFGAFYFLRECGKKMRKSGTGRIINFSTVAVPLDLEGEAAYSASKAAVESLTKTASKELASLGITVNAIGPTPIETDLIRTVPKQKIEELVARQPIKRLGTMDDVLNVIDFFLSPNSEFITGQVIYLGGIHG